MNWASQLLSRDVLVALVIMTAACCAGCFSPGPSVVAPPHMRGASAQLQPSRSSANAADEPLRSRASMPPTTARGNAPSWEFEPPPPSKSWKSIVLHHSATQVGSVASIDAQHRRRKDSAGNPWLGIGYHFVIGNGHGMSDGQVEATFRWREQLPGAHAGVRKHNAAGIGICLIGNFNEGPPTKKQISAAIKLVEKLQRRYLISRRQTLAHRDVRVTDCPGRYFPFDTIVAASPRAD